MKTRIEILKQTLLSLKAECESMLQKIDGKWCFMKEKLRFAILSLLPLYFKSDELKIIINRMIKPVAKSLDC